MRSAMRTIAIVFGDNDFENTFRPLLETVKRVIEHRDRNYGIRAYLEVRKGKTVADAVVLPSISEDLVKKIIMNGALFHYQAFQEDIGRGTSDSLRTSNYLQGIKVLFDEEAEKDILEKDHNHGAWYLELATGKIYSY
jgi:hypothetical protein